MKYAREFLMNASVGGVLIVLPLYLAVLLLLKGMQAIAGLVRPVAMLLPEWMPAVPTPLAGAVYILNPARVHPIDVPFTQAIQSISRWGSGSKDMIAAMRTLDSRAHGNAA